MIPLVLGIVGFALYFIYDINSFTIENRLLGCSFFAGNALLVISTIMMLIDAIRQQAFSGTADILLIVFAIISFAALIYCLFFALPFDETYIEQSNGRPVYDKGAYGLCRHPGIICFFAFYLFLGIAALPSSFIVNGMLFSLLNLLYAYFQDKITFPKCFTNYADYRKRVPFLIPRIKRIRQAVKKQSQSDRKDDIN